MVRFAILRAMPQYPVIGYTLLVSTTPPHQSNMPAVPFRCGVSIQFQPNGPFQPLPINSPEEFMAVVALVQAPGRLMFEPQGGTLEKIQP